MKLFKIWHLKYIIKQQITLKSFWGLEGSTKSTILHGAPRTLFYLVKGYSEQKRLRNTGLTTDIYTRIDYFLLK